ncbi:uncharacterized protein MONBRDRAFT_25468 [Monosiga brevicollis MX1]|uniref:GPI transamidase subunit PIG-U n=1 Tax=Monosiga brevicollis TaxID=81824 RepID=A9UZI1_MONBE|nr:uncharacterized protein MONBRDRAFT_25468 [Monosiga brevicollis MX1]EDQ89374.1 predicted protein [Monosiga brevicollis MX1]|eukprot:XP_001745950.1 hypothetical protein [Monosiga brevicollis MX1]
MEDRDFGASSGTHPGASTVHEAVYLWQTNGDPYSSSLVHEVRAPRRATTTHRTVRSHMMPVRGKQSPLVIALYASLHTHVASFIWLLHIAAAVLLYRLVPLVRRLELLQQAKAVGGAQLDDNALSAIKATPIWLVSQAPNTVWSLLVAGLYLLNPYSIVALLHHGTVVIEHFFLLLAIERAAHGQVLLSSLALALAINQNPFLCLLIAQLLGGSIHFLARTVGARMLVEDQQPNIGVFWYFFTQMFSHYRAFFLALGPTILLTLTPGLVLQLRVLPPILMSALYGMITVFRPYPSFPDVVLVLVLACLPTGHLYVMRYIHASCIGILIGAVLCPVIWYAWVYVGAANPNFYYFATVVLNASLTLFVSDVCYAHLRRQQLLTSTEAATGYLEMAYQNISPIQTKTKRE